MTRQSLTIVFPLYQQITQLDFTGPHQILSRLPGARVIRASADGGVVTAEDGLTFPTQRLAEVGACDVLCVPGGFGCAEAMLDAAFIGEVRRLGLGARYVTSVCTGSLILGAAGLLRGRRAACHWAWRDLLVPFGARPDAARVVRDGHVLTGGGVTAGLDFALTLAAEIAGPDVAQALQLGFEYSPEPPFDAGRPETAPPQILAAVEAHTAKMIAPRREAVMAAAAALRAGADG
ncbi:MAG: DJ-1/PfpI family protein [Caulobacteraceae bacterium]|nr:DJ-1/PfpI family protein [Caulobacteraceae bacterium]